MKLHQILEGKGLSLNAIHYSNKENLTFLDPTKHGTGIRGAERKRQQAYPKEFNSDRIYLYMEGAKKEPGLGNVKYKVEVKNVYDMNKDPDGIKAIAKEMAQEKSGAIDTNLIATIFENIILKKGYGGYFSKKDKIIVYFKKIKIN